MDPQAETGTREIYVDYRYEVSNPLKFEISDYNEVVEPETNKAHGTVMELAALPVCINGRAYGTDPDRYTFQAEAGRKIVAFVKSELLPPGGFVPALQVAGADGGVITNGVAVYGARRAPVLVFEVPSAGRYALLVSGDGKQKWRSAVYRITLGELPLITDFSPAVAVQGKSVNVRLQGVNLEEERVRLFTGGKDSAMCMASIAGEALVLPELGFTLVDEEISADTEPNDSAAQAQALELPVVVRGRLDPAEDGADCYRFQVAPGADVYVDVGLTSSAHGRMPLVRVRDPDGKAVAAEESMPEMLRKILFPAPLSFYCSSKAGGLYSVEIAADGDNASACGYHMRIGPPAPAYDLWMNPASINIPRNGSCLVNLFVHRIHRFSEPISVSVAFPPLGVLSDGGVIAGDELEGLVTVWTDGYRYPRTPFYQELVSESRVDGALLKKPVRPFWLPAGQEGPVSPMMVGKPPARIAYYQTGMCVDMEGRKSLVLSGDKATEVKLLFTNTKGSVAEDYVYSIVAPRQGISIKGVNESSADTVVRLLVAPDNGGRFTAGSAGTLIFGMARKSDPDQLVTASQAVALHVK